MTATKTRTSRSRLFIGIMPTGISYADRQTEEHGDYAKVAFLDFAKLELEVMVRRMDSPLLKKIKKHAATIQAKRGEQFEVSSSGQTVTLGYAGRRIPMHFDPEFIDDMAEIGVANGKTAEQVYAIWHQYANEFSDQSKFIAEFLNWYRKELPNVPAKMRRLYD